jgi:type IV fimbrial biogenesis protein FimT
MTRAAGRGFTLLELMVVVAVIAVVLTLAAPSLSDYILVQRLKGSNAELINDMQLARSEAVARGTPGRVVFKTTNTMSCYTVFVQKPGATYDVRCDCTQGAGAACPSNAVEVKTTQIPATTGVSLVIANGTDPALGFDNVTGGLLTIPTDDFPDVMQDFQVDTTISGSRTLRTKVGRAGRPTVCATAANLGAAAC